MEVQVDGKWGPLCGSGSSDFTYSEAKVICRQLGYSTYNSYHTDGKSWYPSVDTSVYDEAFYIGLSCDGDERSISKCGYTIRRGPTSFCTSVSGYKTVYAGLECENVSYSEGKKSSKAFDDHNYLTAWSTKISRLTDEYMGM